MFLGFSAAIGNVRSLAGSYTARHARIVPEKTDGHPGECSGEPYSTSSRRSSQQTTENLWGGAKTDAMLTRMLFSAATRTAKDSSVSYIVPHGILLRRRRRLYVCDGKFLPPPWE
jgi:hypothetical protein